MQILNLLAYLMNWLIALVEMDSLLNLLMVNTYVSNY